MGKMKNLSSAELKKLKDKLLKNREKSINSLETLRLEEDYSKEIENNLLNVISTLSEEIDDIDNIITRKEYV